MKKVFNSFFLVASILLASFFNSLAQKLTELEKEFLIIRAETDDTIKVNKLNKLFWNFIDADDMKNAELVLKDSKTISKTINYEKGLAQAYHCFGVWHYYNEEYGDAVENYLKSLEIKERSKENLQASATYNNLGIIFRMQDNYPQAIEYYNKSLVYDKKLNDVYGVAISYNNLGSVYIRTKQYDLALENLNKSLEIRKKINDLEGIESTFNNIGLCYETQENYQKALHFYSESLKISEKLKSDLSIAIANFNVGTAHAFLGSNDLALQYFQKAMDMSIKGDFRPLKRDCYRSMADVYLKQQQYKKSSELLLNFISLNDSILKDEDASKIHQLEARFQNVKKQKEIEELENQKKIQAVEIAQKDAIMSKQSIIRNAFIIGFLLATIAVFFIFRGYKQKQEANKLLSIQKVELAEKNKEITDSIKYAKHIQQAILPSNKLIEEYLPESFVFYRPKDVVSGDFYYFQTVNSVANSLDENNINSLIFAVADCTGHGVPGAFMSIIGNQSLKEAISTFGITQPSKILDFSNKSINQTLRQRTDTGAVSDGMDIALCRLDKENNVLEFAGAINSMYIVREAVHPTPVGHNIEVKQDFCNDKNYLIEICGDKQSIGSNDNEKVKLFTNTKFELKKNDLLYLVSDGFADQFGGPQGKKFKYKQLKNLLLEIAVLPLNKQYEAMQTAFDGWKNNLEQVDDVCVMGIKIV
ncbi:MAG: tetratricopeptide repeat protein [Bacteroidota bacterium]